MGANVPKTSAGAQTAYVASKINVKTLSTCKIKKNGHCFHHHNHENLKVPDPKEQQKFPSSMTKRRKMKILTKMTGNTRRRREKKMI